MTKYIIAIAVFLAIALGLSLWRVDNLTKKNTKLEIEKNTCLEEKENYKNAQISSSQLIKELRVKRVEQSPVVDCSNTPLPEYVIGVFSKLK